MPSDLILNSLGSRCRSCQNIALSYACTPQAKAQNEASTLLKRPVQAGRAVRRVRGVSPPMQAAAAAAAGAAAAAALRIARA